MNNNNKFLEQNAIAINESKVDNFISDIQMHIACYNINRKDRNRFGGWVVMYIRDSILCRYILKISLFKM